MDKLERVRELIRVEFNSIISDEVCSAREVLETAVGGPGWWAKNHEYLLAREKVKLLRRLDEKVLEMIDGEPAAEPPAELNREYWHGLLDQAFDQTKEGHSFLPEFVALVLDTLKEKR